MQDPYSERMSASEKRAASGLALVFAFRMLGMFMVLLRAGFQQGVLASNLFF